jgi:hypothetical protein
VEGWNLKSEEEIPESEQEREGIPIEEKKVLVKKAKKEEKPSEIEQAPPTEGPE